MNPNEPVKHPTMRLGRRKPSNKPALRFAGVWTGAIPTHPIKVDRLSRVPDWSMLGNDTWGDCGPVSVANSRALTTLLLTGTEVYPDLAAVLDLYKRSGNPDFDPASGAGDNGVDMQTMLEEVNKHGIAGPTSNRAFTKCIAFAKVDVSNIDEVRAAISIFGFLLLGVELKVAQQSQTNDGLWQYTPRSDAWGGHAVIAANYTSLAGNNDGDVGVETWTQIVGLTDEFTAHQVEEAWVVIWPEHLGTQQFQEGIDLPALAAAYKALTGRQFPVPVPPEPVPAPVPDPSPTPSPQPPPPSISQELLDELKKLWKDIGALLRRIGVID